MIAPLWLITAAALTMLHHDGAPITPAWVIGGNTAVATSIAAARTQTAGHKVIVADVERWQFTPAWQQHHPVWAIRRICRIAHDAGEKCIAAPALDLFTGPRGYLTSGVTRAARYADMWEVQAQSLELHPAAYKAFVTAAIRQARAANPHVMALAGLTTSHRVGNVTGPRLWKAFASVRPVVRGYWANIPGAGPKCPTCGPPDPGPMVYVLRRIGAA